MAKVDLPKIRAQYQTDISDGKISVDDAKDLAKAAKSADGREFLEERLAKDEFDPDARKLLEKAIHKAEGSKGAKADPTPSGLVGQTVGTMDPGKFQVTVGKELGPKGGFENENQARAQALLSGEPRAAVVQDKSGRWQAVQLNVDPGDFKLKLSAGGAAKNLETVKVDSGALQQAQQDYNNATSVEDKIAAYKQVAAAALGVDVSQINYANDPSKLDTSKINIAFMIDKDKPSTVGQQGSVRADGTYTVQLPDDKKTDMGKPAVWLSTGNRGNFDLTDPKQLADFQDTYLHESTHEGHTEMAMKEIQKWRDSGSKLDLSDWMKKEVKGGRLSETDHRLISDAVQTGNGGQQLTDTRDTEALAYLQAFTGAFGKTNVRTPFDQLQATFESTHAPQTDEMKTKMKQQLQEMYDGLSPTDRTKFTDFLKTDKTVPGSWLAKWMPD